MELHRPRGLSSFILDTLRTHKEESDDARYWDLYLHVYMQGEQDGKKKKDFEAWKKSLKSKTRDNNSPVRQSQKNQAKIDEGLSKSYEILKGFKPQ